MYNLFNVLFSQIKATLAAKKLTLSPLNKLSSAKFLVCFNFQRASMLLKICENIVCVSNSFDPGETPSYSASHPDPSCLHMTLKL